MPRIILPPLLPTSSPLYRFRPVTRNVCYPPYACGCPPSLHAGFHPVKAARLAVHIPRRTTPLEEKQRKSTITWTPQVDMRTQQLAMAALAIIPSRSELFGAPLRLTTSHVIQQYFLSHHLDRPFVFTTSYYPTWRVAQCRIVGFLPCPSLHFPPILTIMFSPVSL